MSQIVPRRQGGASRRGSVVRVKLEGLKIVRARGKWYVSHRASGDALIKGFVGDLEREMAKPEFLASYNRKRTARAPARQFASDTLGGLVHWYTNGDIHRMHGDAAEGDGRHAEGYPQAKQLAQ